MVLWASLMSLASAAETKTPFYVPSGATTEMSRMYFYMIKQFEQENPEIDVIFKPKQNWNEVLATVLEATSKGQSAGVAVVEISELLTLKDAHAVIPLDELMEEGPGGREAFLKPIIVEFLANSYGDDGRFYGLPLMRSTPIIYYNMDMLKKAGITIQTLPRTWNELTNTLRKVKAVTGKPPFTLASEWYGWLFEAFVHQNGGALANETNTQVQFAHPDTIETLSYWKMLLDEKLMQRRIGSWKSAINKFTRGKIPVLYYSSGGMGQLVVDANFEWMTDIMPKNKVYSTPVGAGNIFLSTHMSNDEKRAAWKLARFLLKPSNQAQISIKSGYFPVVQAAFEEPILRKRYSLEPFKRARKQLEFASAKIMTRNYVEIRKILKNAIDRTLDEGMSPEDSLKTAQQEAQKWLR
jgi:sn-glycerol 3-phosphate transport system substrate-binding protein